MRLVHCHALLSAAWAISLSAAASAQTSGTTRIAPQVQDLKTAPGKDTAPGTSAGDSSFTPSLPPSGQRARGSSQAIGKSDNDVTTKRLEETSAGLIPPGGVMGLEAGPAEEARSGDGEARAAQPGQVPELHVVQKGDTLWSLCSRYFGDPWRWPQLWAGNPLITNPHWIFPGDVIRLGSSAAGAVPLPTSDKPAQEVRAGLSDRLSAISSNAVALREIGFVEAKDLAQAATLSGSREERTMLCAGDQVYLRFPKERPLRAGERYSVFETDIDHPVIDPDTGKVYGYLVRVQGDLLVDQIAGADTARCTLADSVDVIERGARVSNAIRQFRRIEPRPSDVNLEGRIVAAFSPGQFLAAERFVVLNRGRRDGVQVGNRQFVIRRGDGRRAVLEDWEKMDASFPKEVVGEMLVVDVRDNVSVAWIARSSKELKVGEMTETRKGY